jgi:hypothetical protein
MREACLPTLRQKIGPGSLGLDRASTADMARHLDALRWHSTRFGLALAVMSIAACGSASPTPSGAGGSAGTSGSAGTTGAAGTTGGAGTTGSAGTTGGAGTTGSAGTTGGAGTTGSAGTTGVAGTTGGAGTTGSAGVTGTAGRGGVGGSAGSMGAGGAVAGAGGKSGAGGMGGCPPNQIWCPGCTPGTGMCYAGGCPGGACPPPDGGSTARCADATTLDACDARSDCHAVFHDPRNCRCDALGCCARFVRCADGDRALCGAVPVLCDGPTPHCEGPYVISYTSSCYEGCVRATECAVP